MIKLKNISKIYNINKSDEVKALDNINLEFNEQGFVFIIGKSGNGKTTLLNNIGLLDKPTFGQIYIDNININDLKIKEYDNYRNYYMGYIFQEYNLLEKLTVEENIFLALDLRKNKKDYEKLNEILKLLDLEGFNKRKISDLSTGQKQRVAIARALIKNPKVILADEPTGALDEENSIKLLKILKEISKERLVLVVTHELKYIEEFSDRTIEIKKGKIIKDFYNENNKEINKISNQKTTLFEKYKISLKKIFKLSFIFLKKNNLKVILSILITSFSLIFFSLSKSRNITNMEDKLNEIYKKNQTNIIISKGYLDEYDNGNQSIYFTNKDLDDIKNKYSDYNFIPVYNYRVDMHYSTNIIGNDYLDNIVGTNVTEYSDNFNRYKLLENSKIPTNDNEVLITKFVYEQYLIKKYLDEDSLVSIKSINDIIGKRINIKNSEFIITGVIDTNFDYDKYNILKDEKIDFEKKHNLIDSFKKNIKSNFHNFIFLNEGYNHNNLNKKDITYVSSKLFQLSLDNIEIGNSLTNITKNIDYINTDIFYLDGFEKNKDLKDNEIIIPISSIPNRAINNHNFYNELDSAIDEAIWEYVLADNETDMSNEEYFEYIKNNSTNNYDSEKDYLYFKKQVINDVLDKYFDLLKITFNNIDLKIVGLIDYDYNKDLVVISSQLYDEYYYENNINLSYLVTTLIRNKKTDLNLLTDKEFNNEYICYNFENSVIEEINLINSKLNNLYVIVEYLSYGFLLFSIFYILYVLLNNFQIIKKDFGILKSLGYRNKDLNLILIFESLILSLLIYIINLLASFIIVPIINKSFQNDFLTNIQIFKYKPIMILLTLLISIFIPFISNFIFIYLIDKKCPKDLLN